MATHQEIFLSSIHGKRIVKLQFDSNEKGLIERICIPFDFGPSRRYKDGADRYHFYDLDSPDGKHNLSILPEQITELVMLDDVFEPGDYVTWVPIKWIVARDWGNFS